MNFFLALKVLFHLHGQPRNLQVTLPSGRIQTYRPNPGERIQVRIPENGGSGIDIEFHPTQKDLTAQAQPITIRKVHLPDMQGFEFIK